MKRLQFAFGSLIVLLVMLFAGNAFAQADKSGWDLRTGITVPIYKSSSQEDFTGVKPFEGIGVGLDFQFGYRWKYVGIALEQQFHGMWARHNQLSDALYEELKAQNKVRPDGRTGEEFKKGDMEYLMGSYLVIKEFIPISDRFMFSFGEGAGLLYGPECVVADGADFMVGFKGEVGLSYFVGGWFGIGVNFEYAAILAFEDEVDFTQMFTPALTFNVVM